MNYCIKAITLAFGFMVFNVSYAGEMASKPVVFTFPDVAQAKYPKMIPFIVNSSSLTDNEKQGFLNALPNMTKEQVERLDKILTTEKRQIAEIKARDPADREEVNKKHKAEWDQIKNASSKKDTGN